MRWRGKGRKEGRKEGSAGVGVWGCLFCEIERVLLCMNENCCCGYFQLGCALLFFCRIFACVLVNVEDVSDRDLPIGITRFVEF